MVNINYIINEVVESRPILQFDNFFVYIGSTKPHQDYESDRDRFNDDYTSICLKNLNDHIMVDKLRDFIYHEFKNYKNFTVKIVHNKKPPNGIYSPNSERIAFVNFSHHNDARRAKQHKMNKLFYGFPLYIEPVFRNRGPPQSSSFYNNKQSPSSRSSNRRGSKNRSVSPRLTRNVATPSRSPSPSRNQVNGSRRSVTYILSNF